MPWHTTTRIAENVYRISEPLGAIEPRFGVKTANMYLVVGRERAVLVDSGLGVGDLRAQIDAITSLPCTVLNTHHHWDHVGANASFAGNAIHDSETSLLAQRPNVGRIRRAMRSPAARAVLPPSFDPKSYQPVPKPATRALRDNDSIDLGDRTLRVLHIPGHSPGHVAYWDEANRMLFTGDTAYRGPLYACLEGGDPVAFAESVKRLAALPEVRMVCPGHDDVITEPSWLGKLAGWVEAAVAGKVPGQPRDDFFVGREHRFGAVAVWLPL
jgi:glyoxylase-like metal-dependent hydrolase (beta-lactamase superfamily II)